MTGPIEAGSSAAPDSASGFRAPRTATFDLEAAIRVVQATERRGDRSLRPSGPLVESIPPRPSYAEDAPFAKVIHRLETEERRDNAPPIVHRKRSKRHNGDQDGAQPEEPVVYIWGKRELVIPEL